MAAILERQSGVISREQAVGAGMDDADIRRLVRRRVWARVHAGVYVDHTGPPTWLQRAWAAVLFCGEAALCHESARRAADGPGRSSYDDGQVIHVAIDHRRTVRAPAGVRVHRVVDLDTGVDRRSSPPRLRLEHALLALAASATDEADAVAGLAVAVRAHLTSAAALATALAETPRIARRTFLTAVVTDLGSGTCSALERGYRRRVERPHGLPSAGREVRSAAVPLLGEVRYAGGPVVLLDGRAPTPLSARAVQPGTVVLGWADVFDRGCATASTVALALRACGWTGEVRPCPSCRPTLTRAA